MNRDDIIRLVREAGMVVQEGMQDRVLFEGSIVDALTRFAALVAAAEREKFCSDLRALHDVYSLQSVSAIRERGRA